MLKLHTIKAKCGDCFILEFGNQQNRKFILIDCGPGPVYEKFLKPFLNDLGEKVEFELVVNSHCDGDHIDGLLSLLIDLEKRKNGEEVDGIPQINIKELWNNSLEDYLQPDEELDRRLAEHEETRINYERGISKDKKDRKREHLKDELWQVMRCGEEEMFSLEEVAKRGFHQGDDLRRFAGKLLSIPINEKFCNKLVTIDHLNSSVVYDNLTLHVIGPTQEQIYQLMKKWKKFVREHAHDIPHSTMRGTSKDYKITNLSSIMFLAKADGSSILFTGDGRYDHILEGLGIRGLLDDKGEIRVNVLKIPHHGSAGNVNQDFFFKVIADHYVISGDDRYDNPHAKTLTMIAKAAKQQGRNITIHVTYKDTKQILDFLEICPPQNDFTYKLEGLDYDNDNERCFTISLS